MRLKATAGLAWSATLTNTTTASAQSLTTVFEMRPCGDHHVTHPDFCARETDIITGIYIKIERYIKV